MHMIVAYVGEKYHWMHMIIAYVGEVLARYSKYKENSKFQKGLNDFL